MFFGATFYHQANSSALVWDKEIENLINAMDGKIYLN